jgi:glycosyltransferase involved in cell wall biosynthesis
MNEEPLVSIIIPARNEAADIGRLLASIEALDHPKDRLEVIVVDHDSTDGTRAIAEAAGARVLAKLGGTIAAVRNHGAAAARGEVLAFVDADCTVDRRWLRAALRQLQVPDVGAVGSYHVVPMDPPTWVRKVLSRQVQARPRLDAAYWLPSGNMLVRNSVFRECGGFDERLNTCEDVDLSYRIGVKYRIIADPQIRCWHHGEPRTLRELFRKESWRGRDNLAGVTRHGLRLSELPSLVLPLYSVAALAVLLLATLIWPVLGQSGQRALWWSAVAFAAPVSLLSLLMSARSGDLRYLPHFMMYYSVFLVARGLAPFHDWKNV